MKTTSRTSLFLTCLLISATLNQSNETTVTGCNLGLLQTYSLTGLKIPAIEKIEMCPGITRTCCEKKDQSILFNNFIHGGEFQSVVDHYQKVTGVYSNLMEKLNEVQDFAKTVKNNVVKKVANCKLLAERILNYEVSQVMDQVRQNLAKMQEFFQTTYSGFYCTICNFDNQKYFDTKTQTIYFSERFCRDIVENTLPTMLLFHVDLVKHVNLVTKFVSSCDFTGTYNLDAIVPTNYTFGVVNDAMQDLQACRDNRNKREWFSYCKDICVEFKIASFPKYFEPNLQLIDLFTTYLTKQLNTLTSAQGSRPLFGALSTPNGNNKRILQESKDSSKPIFKPSLTATVDLTKWNTEFLYIGISLFVEGQNSLINENTYNSVKTFLQIQASTAQQKQAIPNSQGVKQPGQNRARKLNKAGLVNVFGVLVVLGFGLFNRG